MTVSHIKVLGIFGYPHKNIQRQFDWQEERSSSAIVNRVVAENVLELSELSWHPGKRYLSRHVHAIIEDLVRWGFIDDPGNYDDKDHDDLGAEDVVDFINGFLTSFGRDFLNYMES